MKIPGAGFLFLFSVAAGLLPGATATEWKAFTSRKYRYSVRYPKSWYLFTTSPGATLDSLDILNFPPDQRAKGVILKESGARIMVGRAPSEVKTVEEWIKDQTKFDTEVAQREVTNFTKIPSGCEKITEVASLSEVGPKSYFSATTYYCVTNQALYAVALLNWKGDPKQNQLRAIALKIATSLTSW